MAASLFENSKVIVSNLLLGINIINNEGIPILKGKWKEDENILNNIKQLKEQSERLSNTCTKLGMIKINEMPLNGLDSLLNEVITGIQSLFQCYSVTVTMPISNPLRKLLWTTVSAIFTELLGFIDAVQSRQFENCKNSIGLVWDANKAIQNLPTTNKIAYRRAIMETMTVIRDTEREFNETLQLSKEKNSRENSSNIEEKSPQENQNNQNEENNNNDEDDDDDEGFDEFDDMGDDDCFSLEETPFVESSLQFLNILFRYVKELLHFITQLNETSQSKTIENEIINSLKQQEELQQALSTKTFDIFTFIEGLKNETVDIGMELYSPLNIKKLKLKIYELIQKTQQIFDSLIVPEEINGSNEVKESIGNLRNIITEMHLVKTIFITIED